MQRASQRGPGMVSLEHQGCGLVYTNDLEKPALTPRIAQWLHRADPMLRLPKMHSQDPKPETSDEHTTS